MPSLIKPASPDRLPHPPHDGADRRVRPAAGWRGATRRGSAGDLLDHLTEQDVVGFTGSASTAQRLRTHPVVVANGVRFTAEADSLNCSILGPDAEPGTAEFDLFVKSLTTEMTVKAGQKCTAIRRAIVPTQFLDAVAEAASARLAKVVVGNPANPDVRMGALARPRAARGGSPLAQGAHRRRTGRVRRSRARRGRRCRCRAWRVHLTGPHRADADRAEPHEVEAFGPVSTLMGYDTIADAIALAARGKGSLVGSLITSRRRRRTRGRTRGGAVARPAASARPRRRRRVDRPRLTLADARTRRSGSRRRGRGDGRRPRSAPPHAADGRPGLAADAHRGDRSMDAGRRPARRQTSTRSASPWHSCGSATLSSPGRARSPPTTSTTSPSSPATPSTRIPIPWRPPQTPSSTASSPTAT